MTETKVTKPANDTKTDETKPTKAKDPLALATGVKFRTIFGSPAEPFAFSGYCSVSLGAAIGGYGIVRSLNLLNNGTVLAACGDPGKPVLIVFGRWLYAEVIESEGA